MNKIIFINGTYGIGKTTIAKRIECMNDKMKCFDPDVYYNEIIKKYGILLVGFPAQNSSYVIKWLKKKIEENIKTNNCIIPMTITTDYSKNELIEYYKRQNIAEICHIILAMDKNKIIERINEDKFRDKNFALENIDNNIRYLNLNFNDAIKIDINLLSVEDLENKIIEIIK